MSGGYPDAALNVFASDNEQIERLIAVVAVILAALYELIAEFVFDEALFFGKPDRLFNGVSFGFAVVQEISVTLGVIVDLRDLFFIAYVVCVFECE